MKRVLLVAAVIFLTSQGFCKDMVVGGGLGYFLPSDKEVKDKFDKNAINLGGFVACPIQPAIDVVFAVDYYKLSKTEKIGSPTTDVKGSLRVIPITLSAIYNIPIQANLSGYVGAGLGLFMAKTTIEIGTLKDSESKSPLGFVLEGGINYMITPNFSVSPLIRYTYAKVKDWEDKNIGGVTIGVLGCYRFLCPICPEEK